MSELRPIKPMTFPDLVPAADFGPRPEIRWVAPTALLVDGAYQRDLSERSVRLIRRMYTGFAWNQYKPPIVIEPERGILHVVDGQHTAITAASLRIPEILIILVDAKTLDERARAFVGHNTNRVTVSPFDIYRALLTSGDADAQDVDNVCRRAGVRIRMISPSSAIEVGDTAAVGLVRALVRRRGVQMARKVLQCLVEAKRAPITGAEIIATDRIICEERKSVDVAALSAVIRIEGSDGLNKAHVKAKTSKTPIWRELANRYLRRLDRGGGE
ncbi:hypothetical protein ACRAVF_27085 [Bradyrhizobium oligotrophicum S58]